MILDQKDTSRGARSRLLFDGHRRSTHYSERKDESHRRADSWHRLDFSVATVALHYAIHLGKAEPRARFALGGEEGLERTLADFGRHADSGVADLDADLAAGRIRPDCQRSAAGHRIERVLNEIEQRLTQFTGDATDHHAAPEVPLELHHAPLGTFCPKRARHGDDFIAHLREIDQFLALTLERFLTDEPADAGRGGGARLRRFRDSVSVIAHLVRVVGAGL